RSTDRGRSWQWIRAGFPKTDRHSFSSPIGAVCFDPIRPNIVYAGIGRPRVDKDGCGAIYRSDDTGVTWRRIDCGKLPTNAIISDLEVQPGNSRMVLAATSQGVYRSDDSGASWSSSSEGLPHRYVEELAFAVSASNTVYVTLRCTAQDKETWNGGVYRSDNSGKTWRSAIGKGLSMKVGKGTNQQKLSSNPKEIVVDPRDANVVYVGNRDWVSAGVYKTTDGGQNWICVAYRWRDRSSIDYGWITGWGPSVECLAISPAAPDRLVFGTSGHVFMSDDGGKSWQQRYSRLLDDGRITGTGLEVTCAWDVLPDPVRPARIYFCYMDIGLLISDDNGKTFRRSRDGMKTGENCFGVMVDPQATHTIWAATGWWNHNEGDFCRSDDDGKTWRVVGSPSSGLPNARVTVMALDTKSPVDKRHLIVMSVENGLFESRDGGMSWNSINGDLAGDLVKTVSGMLLDKADPGHLLVAAGPAICETRNGGKNWQSINITTDFGSITHLTADPRNFGILYVTAREKYDQKTKRLYQGGVFRSDDGGKTWRQILQSRFASSLAVSPVDSNVLYVTTTDHPYHDKPIANGLLKSRDGGRTWKKENSGLTVLNLKSVTISPHDPSAVYLGVSGNSVYIGRDGAVRTTAQHGK
ncbi:MAG: hypothetical protein A2283_01375, partial [Lentisphaerae bacterium RIFOXYA12_FULL_48_11]